MNEQVIPMFSRKADIFEPIAKIAFMMLSLRNWDGVDVLQECEGEVLAGKVCDHAKPHQAPEVIAEYIEGFRDRLTDLEAEVLRLRSVRDIVNGPHLDYEDGLVGPIPE